MATLTITYTFDPGTSIESSEVNTNFDDVRAFLNQQVMHRDASAAFSNVPSGPNADPTTDNHLTRKAYVDTPYALLRAPDTELPGVSSHTIVIPGYDTEFRRRLQIDDTGGVGGNEVRGLEVQTSMHYLVGGQIQWDLDSSGDYRIISVYADDTAIGRDGDESNGLSGRNVYSVSRAVHLEAGTVITLRYRSNHNDWLGANCTLWAWGIPGTED